MFHPARHNTGVRIKHSDREIKKKCGSTYRTTGFTELKGVEKSGLIFILDYEVFLKETNFHTFRLLDPLQQLPVAPLGKCDQVEHVGHAQVNVVSFKIKFKKYKGLL